MWSPRYVDLVLFVSILWLLIMCNGARQAFRFAKRDDLRAIVPQLFRNLPDVINGARALVCLLMLTTIVPVRVPRSSRVPAPRKSTRLCMRFPCWQHCDSHMCFRSSCVQPFPCHDYPTTSGGLQKGRWASFGLTGTTTTLGAPCICVGLHI